MGIFEEGDFYAQEDLNLFYSNFTKYIPNVCLKTSNA